MSITRTSAQLQVAGGILCLKRPGLGHRWEISLYERSRIVGNPFAGGMFLYAVQLPPASYSGKTFAEPIQAAKFIRGILAAR